MLLRETLIRIQGFENSGLVLEYKKTHWQTAMYARHCASQPQIPHKLGSKAAVLVIYVHICFGYERITENGSMDAIDIFTTAKNCSR